MTKIPEIVPISDLRDGAASVLDRVNRSRQPIVITQRGRATAIILSFEEYERSESEKEMLMLLAQGEKDIASGKGHDLDDLMAEADRILGR